MTHKAVESSHVEKHFDSLAESYDRLKKEKNGFYYRSLLKTIAGVVGPGQKVLDIGTGTGEILNALLPSEGTGIDLSSGMIKKAKEKFPHLHFFSGSYEHFDPPSPFDVVLLADVIEHLESPDKLFAGLKKFCHRNTSIVLTMANPAWEPFLHVLEVLKLKMDEGPHHRISEKELIAQAQKEEFVLRSFDSFVLIPVNIPLISTLFNERIGRLPFVRKMALIQRFVFAYR